ncbi:ABC transporter permease [Paenibacillus darwinianus]|uniref:ABC transporter permease n=1 Tax=Paenibacillus darwinianus TaxID=1380763 RepID=UPI00044B4AF0|nr:ABC transporter permease [Paenibacillus darwinianus]EXX85358.1 ABC transporter permease [Paenibacillus darwinianus]
MNPMPNESGLRRFEKLFNNTETGIFVVLLIMCILLTIVSPNFADPYNLGIIMRQFSFVALIALGQTLVLISGGIDLSVGAIAGFSGITTAIMMVNFGINPYVSIVLGLLIGATCGTLNGLFITRLKLNPFIVTLATGEILVGLILVFTKGWPIQGIPQSVLFFGQGFIGPIPLPAVIMILVTIILMYVLKKTPFGRHVYAIGGNEAAARLVGINVNKAKIGVYALSGVFASLAGILMLLRLGAGQPEIGQGWLMPSITAAIIGGTSLMGGQGKAIGTVIGAALMGVLANAIVLLSVSAYWEKVIIGAVVLLAIILDQLRARWKRV